MRTPLLPFRIRRIVLTTLAAFSTVAGLGFLPATAKADDPYRFRRGVAVSREAPLTRSQIRSLLNELKTCTGFQDLKLNDDGVLSIGEPARLVGGSNVARQLLVAAIDGGDSFVLENRNHSRTIAFAEIESSDTYVDATGRRHAVWHVRLDFSDFANLRGPKQAVVSFGPALVLLHELGHGVLKLSDAISRLDPLGDCERHINLIRHELRLPERQSYRPRGWRAVSPGNTAESLQAEFDFLESFPGTQKRLYVAFDVDRVCDVLRVQSLPPGRAEIFWHQAKKAAD